MSGFKVAEVANSKNDEFYTPAYAITPLLRHLPPLTRFFMFGLLFHKAFSQLEHTTGLAFIKAFHGTF